MENTGLLIRNPLPQEWRLGGETGIDLNKLPKVDDWTKYFPKGENQDNRYFDTMACTHFESGHHFEQFMIYYWKSGKLSEEAQVFFKDFLTDPNDISSFRVSKQFLATMGGNTKKGNYFTTAWDAIRNIGVIPDTMLNTLPTAKTWEEYHDKKLVTPAMLAIAKKSLEYVGVMYQWLAFDGVSGLSKQERAVTQKALEGSLINVGIPIPAVHSVEQFSIEDTTWGKFDSYRPYVSHVTTDIHFALQVYVFLKEPQKKIDPRHQFTSNLSYGNRGEEVYWLQKCLAHLQYMNPTLINPDPSKAYFGTNTKNAVIKFQEAYTTDVLAPAQLVHGSGYVGFYTKLKLNELFNS